MGGHVWFPGMDLHEKETYNFFKNGSEGIIRIAEIAVKITKECIL
jgi:hypothetical protein